MQPGFLRNLSFCLFLILKLAYRYKAADIVREEQRIQYMKEMLLKCDLEVEDEGEFISSVLSEISMVKGELMDMDHYYAKTVLRICSDSCTGAMKHS